MNSLPVQVAAPRPYLHGLDTIRFLCAFWVVVSHFGAPPLPVFIDKSTLVGLVVVGLYNNAFSGPAAVIIFFIISGLCIHLPQTPHLRLKSTKVFYIRRYIRILPPMLAAVAMSNWFAGVNLALFEQTILWSLLAELIYYTVYPALLAIRRHFASWWPVFLVSFLAALAVAATDPTAGNYPSYGVHLNWLLGLPCWLLGCMLAEHLQRRRVGRAQIALTLQSIWLWRGATLALATACSIMRFHTALGYPWTLNFFALVGALWVYAEIERFSSVRPSAILEWAGSWSYSLYLFHVIAIAGCSQFLQGKIGGFTEWAICMSFILISSYFFAVFFEFTSHKLARTVASFVQADRPVTRELKRD